MPNWAEGSLKIRGTRVDIIDFLKGALLPCQNFSATLAAMRGEKVKTPDIAIDEDEWGFTMTSDEGFYIKGCGRAFVGNIDWEFREDSDIDVLVIEDFKSAWGVDAKPFAKLSKENNVDIKIYAFERGMEFNQDIEIHKGEIIKNNEITFDDYNWECISPNIGG